MNKSDQIDELFSTRSLKEPSSNFRVNLMAQINRVEVKKKRDKIFMLSSSLIVLSLGIFAILLFYPISSFMQLAELYHSLVNMKISPILMIVAGNGLFLLLLDLIILKRRRVSS